MPPVSNVMPLPTSATVLAFLFFAAPVGQPHQPRRARRALADADRCRRSRPWPVPCRRAPRPPGRPHSPKAFARLANSAGNRWLGGVLTKSRAVATAVAMAGARGPRPSWRLGCRCDSAVILRRPLVFRRGLVAAELGEPVAAQDQTLDRRPPGRRSDSVVMTVSAPDSDRAATPAARRITSAGHSSRSACRARPRARWPPAATAPPAASPARCRPWRRAPAGAPRSRRRPRRRGTGWRRPSLSRRRRHPLTTGTISTAESSLAFGQRGGDGDGGGLVAGICGAHEG